MNCTCRRVASAVISTLAVALLIVLPSEQAIAAPVLGGQLFGTGGDVTVEVLPADANDLSELRLCSPGPERLIATNRDVGKVVNLGSFPAGEELIFCIVNLVTGHKFFMGPGSRNPDTVEHAVVDQTGQTTAIVGFEDLFGGGDRDYNDNLFKFTGVVPPPREPVAVNDDYTTPEDTELTVPGPGVLGNDSDPDGSSLTALLVTAPAHGTVTLGSNGSFTYLPAANFSGPDSFSYKANDGESDSNEATVTILVGSVPDTPVARDDSYVTDEDTVLDVQAPGVLVNDTDADGDPLTTSSVDQPGHGTVTLNSDGSFSYQPIANYSGPDSFTYRTSDGTSESNTATVHITVEPINDPPECETVHANLTSLWPANDKLVLLSLSGGSDIEGGQLSIQVGSVTQDEPVNGLGDGNTGPDAIPGEHTNEVRLRAERSGSGDGRVYTIGYTVSDSEGGTCSGTVTVAVPHDEGRGSTAVDSGLSFDSFGTQ